jgi:peptidyl-prolyl cis-trans isomerase D
MLQSIRDRLTGPVVWFVIGLIAIPFAFWGIDTFRSGSGDPVVAKIGGFGPFGGTRITQSQFKQRYEQRYQQLRQLMGEQFRADLFDTPRFRQSVLDDMVQETAMRTFGQDEGYRAGDDQLRNFLAEIPAFQKDGKFSAETYREMISRQPGLTATTYEAQVRQALVIDQLKAVVEDTAFVTPADAWASYRLEGQSRKIAVAHVTLADFKSEVSVTDDQLKARYEKDKSKYRTAERIKLAYVELDRNKLKPTDAPPPDELKKIYDAEKDVRFSTPEERHARHLLVAVAGGDKAAAKAKAEKLLEEIKAGKDFVKAAQESSDDTGSKASGGDLDWLRKGSMPVKEIEDAVFSMKPGEVRGPIETQFGFHLLKVDEIRDAQVKPYEDAAVQTELAEAWRVREAEKKFQETSDKLDEIAFEKSAIADVAKEVGLTVQTTDWIGRGAGGEGLAGNDAVKQAAFAPEVTTEDQNSKPIVVDSDRIVVVHKAEYEAARDRPLEEVKDQVREAVVAESAAALAKKEGDALAEAVKGGQPLAAAAAAHHGKVTFDGDAKRNQAGVEDAVLAHAFKLARPEAGKAVVDTIALPSGDVAVVALTAVEDPAKPEAADDQLKAATQQMRDSVAGSEFGAYRKTIEEAVKVEIVNPPKAEDLGDAQTPEG